MRGARERRCDWLTGASPCRPFVVQQRRKRRPGGRCGASGPIARAPGCLGTPWATPGTRVDGRATSGHANSRDSAETPARSNRHHRTFLAVRQIDVRDRWRHARVRKNAILTAIPRHGAAARIRSGTRGFRNVVGGTSDADRDGTSDTIRHPRA